MLYWQVGIRIRREILQGKRARYGEKVVAAVATRLEVEFGRGFGEKNLRRLVQFAEPFPDEQIVAALLRQLGWTHLTLLLPVKDSLRREFYAEMCRIERWNTGALQPRTLVATSRDSRLLNVGEIRVQRVLLQGPDVDPGVRHSFRS